MGRTKTDELNPMQARFVLEYLADSNATQSSTYAGCSSCGGTQNKSVPHRKDVPQADKGLGRQPKLVKDS